ncbi:MAG: hypothetical protein OHK0029_09180 [Armatimonadaceae bacterium]
MAPEEDAGIQETTEERGEAAKRLHTEEALRASEDRYRTLFDSIDDGFVVIEIIYDDLGNATDYRFIEVNPAFIEQTRLENIVGRTALELVPGLEHHWIEAYAEVAETGVPLRTVREVKAMNQWFEVYAFRFGTPEERRVAVLSNDVTARRQAEANLRSSEAHLSAIFARAAVGLSEISLSGYFLRVNDELCRILGRSRKELLTLGVADVTHPEDVPPSVQALGQASKEDGEGVASLDKRYRRPDGELVWANSSVTLLRDRDGSPRSFLVVTADLSERKRAEEAVQMALEAVAQANEALERRVEERTEALVQRSEELAQMSQMRQELLRQLVTAQEEERARIARDLHDDTGQQVAALLLGLKNLQNLPVLRDDPAAQTLIASLQKIAGEVAQKSHRIAFTLRPTALDDIGLMGALQNYIEEWQHWTGLPVDLQSVGMENEQGEKMRLPPEIETTIYRVTQEALSNVLRHAAPNHTERKAGKVATRVSVLVQRTRRDVLTIIEDDGAGFDVEAVRSQPAGKRRLGIFGMEERARTAGGTLTVESEPGQGTSIYLRLPLP